MRVGRLFSFAVVGVLAATAAYASPGRLVGFEGSEVVFVWRDADAQSEAMSLINAGVHQSNPSMLMPLLSCIAPSGTRAVITDGGFVTQDVLVIEGENSGCRGNVATENFSFD